MIKVEVNQDLVRQEMDRLSKYSLVAYFVGGRIASEAIPLWIIVYRLLSGIGLVWAVILGEVSSSCGAGIQPRRRNF